MRRALMLVSYSALYLLDIVLIVKRALYSARLPYIPLNTLAPAFGYLDGCLF